MLKVSSFTMRFSIFLISLSLFTLTATSAGAEPTHGGRAGASGGTLVLKVVQPLSGSARVVVRGPGGCRRVFRSPPHVRGLSQGRYRISAPTVDAKRWYSKPEISRRSFRIGAKSPKATVRVSYWDTISKRTRRAKRSADVALNWSKGEHGVLRSRAQYPAGAVVASAPSRTAPDGYLLRIASVDGPAGGIYTYQVTPATLTEAIPRGSFTADMSLELARAGAQASAGEKKPLASCSGSASASAELALSGELPVQFDADWSLFGDDSFTVTARPKVELRANAELNGSGSCKINEQQLWKRSFNTFVVWVGPVPVVITPELEAAAGANISANGSAKTQAAVGLSGELKARASSH